MRSVPRIRVIKRENTPVIWRHVIRRAVKPRTFVKPTPVGYRWSANNQILAEQKSVISHL